jgi:ActR/RegA family two-component response regulator
MKDSAPARRVMIVDDDPGVLELIRRIVGRLGYRTVVFHSFEEARTALGSPAPDALIVDVRLGEHNGLQLVHMFRQLHPEMVCVVVSGFDDPVLREEAALVGAKYLLKPQDLPLLKDCLPPPQPA